MPFMISKRVRHLYIGFTQQNLNSSC